MGSTRWVWMNAGLSLIPIMCGCGARSSLLLPCPLETTSVQVPSTTPWSDTGVDVTAGLYLHITATGTVTYKQDPTEAADPNGGAYDGRFYTNAVIPSTVNVSLIGKVGGTTALGTGTLLPEGTPGDGAGFVGASYDKLLAESGRLFLGFNDMTEAFGDNDGAFTVTITQVCY
jgi:hypothetical protein